MQVFQNAQVSLFLLLSVYPCLDLTEDVKILVEVEVFPQTVAAVLKIKAEFIMLE